MGFLLESRFPEKAGKRTLWLSMKVIDSLLNFREKGYVLSTNTYPIIDLKAPETLSFPLNGGDGGICSSLVDKGDKLEYGQAIWKVDDKEVFPSPVEGEVVDLVNVPETHGDSMVPSITVKPGETDPSKRFPALDPDKATLDELKKRLEETAIQTDRITAQPLVEMLCPSEGSPIKAVVILAMDREPVTVSYLEQYRERADEVSKAAYLLQKVSGADKTFVALPKSEQENLQTSFSGSVTPLWLPNSYPAALDPFVIKETEMEGDVAIISVETALAALDAVCNGQIQIKKTITVVGPDSKVKGVYRVWIGTAFNQIFQEAGLEPSEKDRIVAGGPMLGFAQYSLDGTVDAGINTLMLIPASESIPWSTEPCINCGKCIDACPVNLQVQLIGRYSEFSLFERTKDYEIDGCINCGLCASACTARRPLLQMIDLAKRQLIKLETGEKEAVEADAPATVKGRRYLTAATGDPAMSLFSGNPRFTVGYAPHWRSKSSITKMNIAFILFLIPTIIVSAFGQFYGSQAVELDASITSVSSVLRTLTLEMGLDTGFLWFSGVFGTVLFGMGLGLLIEYACQVLMRQPYYATNGHGALMGLIIALLMPPSVPAWIMLVAVAVAIFMAKQVFGGIGGYPMHPALVGWLVVYLSWPQYVYPIGTASIAGFNTAVIVMTILGGIGLLMTGYIRFEITLGVIIGTLLFGFLMQESLGGGGIGEQFFSGHVFLAAFFLATDATSSPANKLAMWIYGIGIGFLIILIRAFGVWPDAVPFAVLLMNVLSPLLDRIKPKVIKMAT